MSEWLGREGEINPFHYFLAHCQLIRYSVGPSLVLSLRTQSHIGTGVGVKTSDAPRDGGHDLPELYSPLSTFPGKVALNKMERLEKQLAGM